MRQSVPLRYPQLQFSNIGCLPNLWVSTWRVNEDAVAHGSPRVWSLLTGMFSPFTAQSLVNAADPSLR